LIPLDLWLVIVSSLLEEDTGCKHVVVGLDKKVWLVDGIVI
jgi:hypothetical protein